MKHSPAGLLQAISVPSIASTGNLARVVRLAQCITGAHLAVVSLLGADNVSSTHTDAGFSAQDITDICQYAILHHTPVIRSGLQCVQHPDYPILDTLGLYVAWPLRNPEGYLVGVLCLADLAVLTLSEAQKDAMVDLVALAETEFLLQDVDETQSDLLLELNQARHESLIDPLLRVWNRRGIMELLEREIKYSRRERRQLTLAYIDIDHFKRINDCFGHPVGDIVLQAVTQCIREMIRGYDLVGRIGGEEILAIFPNVGTVSGQTIAEKILLGVRNRTFHYCDDSAIPVTVSIGLATCDYGAENLSVEALIEAADQALYTAKAAGRDRIALAGNN